jgi:hypothetical protein
LTSAGDPVSWFLIEPGWKVVCSDGTEVGTVQEVVGDTGKDIFDGLAVSTGMLGKPRYVPSEQVRSITEGRIELDLDQAEAANLGEYEEPPPSEEIMPVTASRWERLRDFFRR